MLWAFVNSSVVRLAIRKSKAFRSRSAYWTLWLKSRVDQSVLTLQQQSRTILLALAELVKLFYVIQSVGDCNCAAGKMYLILFAKVY